MTPYQVFLFVILFVWPVIIFGILFLMSKLEIYVSRLDADTPEEAGLAPVAGSVTDREVKIVFGDKIVGEPKA